MNPCPCGRRGERSADCRCDDAAVARYRARLSGPLLDRIDLHVSVSAVPFEQLADAAAGEPSATIRARVVAARERQLARSRVLNAQLRSRDLRLHAALDAASAALLDRAVRGDHLSARGYDRVLRVARTLADLAGCERVERDHVAEALLYRRNA